MELIEVDTRNTPGQFKRYRYVCNEVRELLDKCRWNKGQKLRDETWIVASHRRAEVYSRHIFGSSALPNVTQSTRAIQKDRNIEFEFKGADLDSDYQSLDAEHKNDKNRIRKLLGNSAFIICVLVPVQSGEDMALDDKDTYILQTMKDISSDLQSKECIIYFADCQKITPEAMEKRSIGFLDFSDRNTCHTKQECLKLLTENFERQLVGQMQQLKNTFSQQEDKESDIKPEMPHKRIVEKLDQLIEMCSHPQLSQEIPTELTECLTSATFKDVQGFGLVHNKFKILIRTDNEELRQRILDKASKYYDSHAVEVVQVSESNICEPHASTGSGDKLIKENAQAGTIAFCCKMRLQSGDIRTVLVTASHVLRVDEKVYIETDTGNIEVGHCIYSPNEGSQNRPSLVDIAVVEVRPELEGVFHTNVLDREKQGVNFKISSDTCSQYTQVWKHGASSNMTEGIVASPEFVFNVGNQTRKLTLIEGSSGPFSVPGDSGASVLFQYDDDGIKGLSIVTGEGGMINQHPPDPTQKPLCSTAKLKTAIDRFESDYGAKLLVHYS